MAQGFSEEKGVKSFERRQAVHESKRRAVEKTGRIGAYELAMWLAVSKRRALQLLAAGRISGATRVDGEWRIPVSMMGEALVRPGARGPRLRIKQKRRRVAVYRV